MPGARIVPRTRLALSRDPSGELAAAAIQAMQDDAIPGGQADFIIVAVPAGAADDAMAERIIAAAAPQGDRTAA